MVIASQEDMSSIWAPYLDKGEELLWSGRPSSGIALPMDSSILNVIGGTLGLLMGIGIVSGAITPDSEQPPSMGWVFIVVCTGMIAIPLIWASWRRANSFYAVTNRRALVLRRALSAESLKSWHIRTLPSLEFSGLWRKSIWLENSQSSFFSGRVQKKLGSELIPDAEAVYRLLVKIQRDAQ